MTESQNTTAISTPLEPSHNAAALDPTTYQSMHQLAVLMATGTASVPTHLRGNEADCMAVVLQAMAWQMNPFAVASKTYTVNGGMLAYEAQLVNAVITSKAPVTGRLNYEWFGDWSKILGQFREVPIEKKNDGSKSKTVRVPNWSIEDEQGLGIRVWATFVGETEPRKLDLLLLQARTRNSTMWADDPKMQLAYLAIKKWARLYCPDVILGVYTPDEFDDFGREIDITPVSPGASPGAASGATTIEPLEPKKRDEDTIKLFRDLLEIAKKHDFAAYETAWKGLKPPQRSAIGQECHDRLKSIASTVDAEFTEVKPQAEEATA